MRFGISVRRLNNEFAGEYGVPIYAFISEWRLNAAYLAIHDSDIALKTLAERLGYAYVNFNAAFKKQFGHPPGQLRRSG
jgi:AraC-like DNA-binding protein